MDPFEINWNKFHPYERLNFSQQIWITVNNYDNFEQLKATLHNFELVSDNQ